eukprot:6483363-Amphidinium_carterae.1
MDFWCLAISSSRPSPPPHLQPLPADEASGALDTRRKAPSGRSCTLQIRYPGWDVLAKVD